ncbi:class I SAM-dependent methyltransferase [Candidatus Tisiphia endosymbiont of Oplodontha viridula]|uniref:class I SAM-dependent methyltransferase n=1 Tax=Candidatus Tisiphia endosymbiont of Oplodontha viridula TaxID=3077925 RepID=UPI0035C9409A
MPIDSKIRKLIEQNGSIKLDEMMLQVTSISPSSYYQRQNKLGCLGDFTTAPEISQLFGEMIALWAIDQWYKMGCPQKTNLVELGPGQGVLMRDLLNVAKLVPEFYQSLSIELIDINPHFIKKQQTNLKLVGLPIKHHTAVQYISEIPSIIIANEFFDAMPIKQYVKAKELWYESTLIIDPADGKIKFDKIEVSKELQRYLLQEHSNAHDGAVIEESPKSLEIIKFISQHIVKFGGASLVIDYGYDIDPIKRTRNQYNPTLQAIKNHKYYPLLETLGEADLSAHVDFYALKTVCSNMGVNVHGSITQRDFLISNGILLRSQLLQSKLPTIEANIIAEQVDRLIAPNKMGLLFKVLYLVMGKL